MMDENCIFCKIVNKTVPSNIVYEDDNFMAFMDIKPLNKGHVLLIPKNHYRWVWDVPNFGEYWEVARKVAKAQMNGLGVKMVEFLTHGMEIEHCHIWIVPIYENEVFIKAENRLSLTDAEMADIADKIKSGFSS